MIPILSASYGYSVAARPDSSLQFSQFHRYNHRVLIYSNDPVFSPILTNLGFYIGVNIGTVYIVRIGISYTGSLNSFICEGIIRSGKLFFFLTCKSKTWARLKRADGTSSERQRVKSRMICYV